MERLEESAIRDELPPGASEALASLVVLETVDSTNRYLLDAAAPPGARLRACVAGAQTAGRGRRGRRWVSPPGANLYLSVSRTFAGGPDRVQGLSLAVGVAVAEALAGLGVTDLALKWPNDIQIGGRKLGGILVELSGRDRLLVVIGVGINVAMPEGAARAIDQPWTDLAARGVEPARNRLAARVLARVVAAVESFDRDGFEAFREGWARLDGLRDTRVAVHDGSGIVEGIARGVDATGALLLEVAGERRRIVSGDPSPSGPDGGAAESGLYT